MTSFQKQEGRKENTLETGRVFQLKKYKRKQPKKYFTKPLVKPKIYFIFTL